MTGCDYHLKGGCYGGKFIVTVEHEGGEVEVLVLCQPHSDYVIRDAHRRSSVVAATRSPR